MTASSGSFLGVREVLANAVVDDDRVVDRVADEGQERRDDDEVELAAEEGEQTDGDQRVVDEARRSPRRRTGASGSGTRCRRACPTVDQMIARSAFFWRSAPTCGPTFSADSRTNGPATVLALSHGLDRRGGDALDGRHVCRRAKEPELRASGDDPLGGLRVVVGRVDVGAARRRGRGRPPPGARPASALPSVFMSILFGIRSAWRPWRSGAEDVARHVAALLRLLLDADQDLVLFGLLVALDADLAEVRPVQDLAHLVDVGPVSRSGRRSRCRPRSRCRTSGPSGRRW